MTGTLTPNAESQSEQTFRIINTLEDQLIGSSSFGERRDDENLGLARNIIGLWDRYMSTKDTMVSRDFYAAPHVYALGTWIEDEKFPHLWHYLNNKISRPLSPEQVSRVASYRENYRIKERD